jgi:membrane protein YqaA with SNARE-associated domain
VVDATTVARLKAVLNFLGDEHHQKLRDVSDSKSFIKVDIFAFMLNVSIQNARPPHGQSLNSMFRHLGALGLFFLAILDSSPLPTFGGPDILTAILAATHRNPWYEYAAVATAGSVLGAYLTFRIARKAGAAYLHSKFGNRKLDAILSFFHQWGTSALAVSSAVPFPFPTSVFFAAAGASEYSVGRFLTVVTICRGARYAFIAIIADHYGRHFIRALRHPAQYWGWLLLFAVVIFSLIMAGIVLNRRLTVTTSA